MSGVTGRRCPASEAVDVVGGSGSGANFKVSTASMLFSECACTKLSVILNACKLAQ